MSFVVRIADGDVSTVVGPWDEKVEAIAWYHGVNEAFEDHVEVGVYEISAPFTLEQAQGAQNLTATAGIRGGLLAEPSPGWQELRAPNAPNVINGHTFEEPRTVAASIGFLRLISDSDFTVLEDFHPMVPGSLTLVDPESHSAITLLVFESSDEDDDANG